MGKTQEPLMIYHREYVRGCGSCSDCEIEKEDKTDTKNKFVPMYKCLLHNDDFNTMEHVINVLFKVFAFNVQEAYETMKEAHETGIALCRIEVFEQAEFHADQMKSYGLVSSIEPV